MVVVASQRASTFLAGAESVDWPRNCPECCALPATPGN